ncbi:MAG: InlB B-repeat-containing protein [Methanobrevibacter sp.]|nr:InlB B-repeat-containing protein [Methanobrevibacter sp.]
MKSIKKIVMVLAIAMLMFTMVLATSFAVSVPKDEKKDTGILIESKEKVVSCKIIWDANGGKIGNKKTVATTVKKGSKINKLTASPKRSGYTFKGWYTKKTGGTKISKNTKPSKSVTYFAQWKKKSPSLSTTEKKLLGVWSYFGNPTIITTFREDKTFSESITRTSVDNTGRISRTKSEFKGSWSVSGDTIQYTNCVFKTDYHNWMSTTMSPKKPRFGSDEKGQYAYLDNYDRKYYK